MDPLVVTCRLRKQVNLFLADRPPLALPDLLTNHVNQREGRGKDSNRRCVAHTFGPPAR
jgi:hypothetical protein